MFDCAVLAFFVPSFLLFDHSSCHGLTHRLQLIIRQNCQYFHCFFIIAVKSKNSKSLALYSSISHSISSTISFKHEYKVSLIIYGLFISMILQHGVLLISHPSSRYAYLAWLLTFMLFTYLVFNLKKKIK